MAFEKCVRPYFDSLLSNLKKSAALGDIRDTLLPKLLSGQLRIPDAEKFVKDVLV